LDEKLDTLESKAREAFDLKHQVAERPWMAMGAALAAGYVLGSMGGEQEQQWHGQPMVTTDYTQHVAHKTSETSERHEPSRTDGLLAQFDDEIDMLKAAAVSTLVDFLRSAIHEYVPALGQHLDQEARNRGLTPTTSPGASMRYGTRTGTANYEGIPESASSTFNQTARTTSSEPNFAGSAARTSETERERSVGESTARY
jgi:hypothetical protein